MKKLLFFSIFSFAFFLSDAQPFGDTINIVSNNSSCTLAIELELNDGTPPLCSPNCWVNNSNTLIVPPYFTGFITLGCPSAKVTRIKFSETVTPGSIVGIVCNTMMPQTISFISACTGGSTVFFDLALPASWPSVLDISIY